MRAPQPRRLLLVSLDNLGDLVFASALTPPLRERFPDVSITLWCKAYTRDIGALVRQGARPIRQRSGVWKASPKCWRERWRRLACE